MFVIFVMFVMFVIIVCKSTLNFHCIGLAYGMYWQCTNLCVFICVCFL